MTRGCRRALAGAAAAGLLVAGGRAVAQQELSAQEVESFFQSAEADLTRMVRAGEYARLSDWMEASFADGASFHLSLELETGGERKGFAVLTLTKQDVLRLGGLAFGAMADRPGALQDYALDIQVTGVEPLGPDAAKARTQFVESGKLAPPGEGGASSEPVPFETTAQCEHVVRRDREAKRLVIGMTTCRAGARL